MPGLRSRPLLVFPILGALALAASLALISHSAAAQSATGTITGRVMWGSCVRGIPMPVTPDVETLPATPEGQTEPGGATEPSVQPAPGVPIKPGLRPVPAPTTVGLPAGAVLVAVQNTAVSARTDETGRFTLSGAPAGQYLTVAAGPVANSTTTTAVRPNVFVNGGQSVEIGTLVLGGMSPFGIACRAVPGLDAAPGEAPGP